MLRIFARPYALVALALAALQFASADVALAQGARDQGLRPTFGRVLTADGQPFAAGVVTLVGGLPHLSTALQDVHVVEVACDRRGRVVARLQPGLCYVAWASGPSKGEGPFVASEPFGYFAAGAMFEVICTERQGLRSCRLEGEAAWQHLGALRFFAMTAIPGTERELERRVDGSFSLPGSIYDRFEIRTPDGQPLWHSRIAAELSMPPPQKVRVVVTDEAGVPLAGAAVQHRVGRLSSWMLDGLRSVGQDRTRALGVTDDRGVCEVEVPYDGNPLRGGRDNLLLFVQADGRPMVAGGVWNRAIYVSDHKVPRIKGDELRFACPEVAPLRGMLAEAPEGTVAHLAAICKLHLQRNSFLHDARVFTASVDGQGRFSFDDVPAELHSSRLSFVPPPGSAWQPPVFAPEVRRELPVEVVPAADQDAPPISLSTVKLAIKDPGGGPARGAVAFVSSGDRAGVLMRDSLLRVALDERGSAELRLVPGVWVCVVLADSGYCGHQIDLGDADEQVEISLQPLASMEVTLLDGQSEPVVGAGLRSRGTSTRGTKDPVRSILQGLRRVTRMHWERLRTGDDGKVSIRFVPVEGVTQRVEMRWSGGRSEEFALAAGSELTVRPQEPAGEQGNGRRRLPNRR